MVLNFLVWLFDDYHYIVKAWSWEMKWVFLLGNNLALLISEMRFSTIVHRRMISAGDIVQRVVGLVLAQMVVAYVIMKMMSMAVPVGRVMLMLTPPLFGLLIVSRMVERWVVKLFRQLGRNSRTATFIGNDPELMNIYEKLVNDSTMGYRIMGYYADNEMGEWTHTSLSEELRVKSEEFAAANDTSDFRPQTSDLRLQPAAIKPQPAAISHQTSAISHQPSDLKRLGTLQEFMQKIETEPESLNLGDELYVSLSRRDRDIIKRISRFCDHQVIRFYYVPVSVESLGINLKREMLDDMEVFTTYEIPLANPVNKAIKRAFDIAASLVFLIPTALMFPIIYLIIKIQSPGPIFFRQKRTGLDGKDFEMLKFRSMHVNKDADKVQATKNDPRKYPFGNFMRKSNIDELPQFLNVLKGDMSFVGPRPHMLLHTEQYSQLIDKYMVRHFVKPGLTGWAQVTGYRGETKELWQMEGRVKRDIWYIEHWSIWLDIRIIWLTAKTIFIHDKNAY